MRTLKLDMSNLLTYKNDLELLLEKATNSIEQKNRKLAHIEEKMRQKDVSVTQAEASVQR
jgi:hypothetical protein